MIKGKRNTDRKALEALIGAIFLDKDHEIAKQFVFNNFSKYIDNISKDLLINDSTF